MDYKIELATLEDLSSIYQCKIDNKSRLHLDYYQKLGFENVGDGAQGNYQFNLWEMIIKI